MTIKTKQKIVNAIPIKIRLKYARLYDGYFDEIHDHYHRTMKDFSLHRILVRSPAIDGSGDFNSAPEQFAFQQPGKTGNYSQFLANRKRIQEQLLIVHPCVKYVLDSSVREFPAPLIDLAAYQASYETTSEHSLVQFEMAVKKELELKSLSLRRIWYPSVSNMILKYHKRSAMSKRKLCKLLNCIERLISRQLTTLKMETFERMLRAIRPIIRLPYVMFNLTLTNCQYELQPNFDQFFSAHEQIILTIMNIGTDFICLEGQIDRTLLNQSRDPQLNVQMGEGIEMEIIETFRNALANAYAPIFQHVDRLKESFAFICSTETQTELSNFFSMPRQNNDYLQRIDIFREYMKLTQTIVDKEHFTFATVRQTDAVKSLKEHLLKYIDKLTNGIIDNHRMDCTRVSQWLTEFEKRALEKPVSTEMLLANGEYMVNVKKVELEQINLDIQYILEVSKIVGSSPPAWMCYNTIVPTPLKSRTSPQYTIDLINI